MLALLTAVTAFLGFSSSALAEAVGGGGNP